MSSLALAQPPYKVISNRRTLQRLRRQAGYRSAKEFAEALGIPSSTYSRYERAGDGADCGIPLSAAWAIADKLGCSIDLVVGREDIDEPVNDMLGNRIATLSHSSFELLDDYLRFLEFRDNAISAQDWR